MVKSSLTHKDMIGTYMLLSSELVWNFGSNRAQGHHYKYIALALSLVTFAVYFEGRVIVCVLHERRGSVNKILVGYACLVEVFYERWEVCKCYLSDKRKFYPQKSGRLGEESYTT